jgi:hypothetical protein
MMWRHKKRGTVYRELGRGFASIAAMPIEDHTAVVVYQGLDGTIWVRNAVEFDDGRFEPIIGEFKADYSPLTPEELQQPTGAEEFLARSKPVQS